MTNLLGSDAQLKIKEDIYVVEIGPPQKACKLSRVTSFFQLLRIRGIARIL